MAREDEKRRDMSGIQGEGNPVADEEYRERTKDFMDAGRVEPAASEAEKAVEGREAEELERAKREGLARKKEDDV